MLVTSKSEADLLETVAGAEPSARRPLTTIAIACSFFALYVIVAAPALLKGSSAILTDPKTILLAIILLGLSVYDATTFRLPNVLTLSLLAVGIALAPIDTLMWHAIAATVAGGTLLAFAALYKHARQHEGLGMGDVKLFAAAGAWVGLGGLSSVLLIASVTALSMIFMRTLFAGPVDLKSKLAFGPFIALGLWVVWLYGPLDTIARDPTIIL